MKWYKKQLDELKKKSPQSFVTEDRPKFPKPASGKSINPSKIVVHKHMELRSRPKTDSK